MVKIGGLKTKAIVKNFRKGFVVLKRREEEKAAQGTVQLQGAAGPAGAGNQYFAGQFLMPGMMYPAAGKEKDEKGTVMKEITGIEIPSVLDFASKPLKRKEEENELRGVNMSYHLVPASPRTGEQIFAYANIKWDAKRGEVIYTVIEPEISQSDKEIINKVKADLEERLNVDFTKLGVIKSKELLKEEIEKSFTRIPDIQLDEARKRVLTYYIEKEVVGFGRLDAIMKDPNIEDVSCDGYNIPIYVYHRNPRFGSLKTNIYFTDNEELDSFVMKLAQKCNKNISIAKPLLDGTLPGGSRVQATLGTDIARKGSNFTIRKFTEKPLTPTHMLKFHTLNSTQLAYLWLAIENGQSMLVSGGTATGKSSMLNVLSLFIRPNAKVVSIEDTAELRLPLPHWVPHVARTAISVGGKVGEVSLFDLLKSSLRQRPDYIIVGEVRGKETYVLFQQIASIPAEENAVILNDMHLKSLPIGSIEKERFKTISIDPITERFKIMDVKERVRHSPVKELYKITTQTGREVTTTSMHSVFTYKDGLCPAFVRDMKPGDTIVIPQKIPCGFSDIEYLDLMDMDGIRVYSPRLTKTASRKLGFDEASKTAERTTISNYYGVNNCALPAGNFKRLMKKAGIDYKKHLKDIKVRFERNSTFSDPMLEITPEFLRLLGYYVSEGSLNKAYRNNNICLCNSDEKVLDDMRACIKSVTGKPTRERETKGWGTTTELAFSNKTLFEVMRRHCGSGCGNKKVPNFIFGLNKERIGHFLSALFTGDGWMRSKDFGYATSSRTLANDVCLLLSCLGIVGRISKGKGTRRLVYYISFYRSDYMKKFLKYARPIKKMPVIRKSRLSSDDDIYLDKVKSIIRIRLNKPKPVYDFCVPGGQNFIGGFGGVLLHNTGHTGLATIHAANFPQLIDRLITPPISLPPTLLENIGIIVFLSVTKMKGSYVRRANTIVEIAGMKEDRPVFKTIFEWKPAGDTFELREKSIVLKAIADRQGLSEDHIKEELARRKRILEWMLQKKIFDYKDVAKVVSTYYTNPTRLMDYITGEKE